MSFKEKTHLFIQSHRRWVYFIVGMALILVCLAAFNYFRIGAYGRYIKNSPSAIDDRSMVGIVLGGGVDPDGPRPTIRARLDAAAELLRAGKVRKLIVSGDNRFVKYNEPKVMKRYLVEEQGLDPAKIQEDYAGRSTYETCERAKKIFGLDKTILISDGTHLPRAIYLCRSFGVEAYGYSSTSSSGEDPYQRFREVIARTKAGINVYIIGEPTALGEKIDI